MSDSFNKTSSLLLNTILDHLFSEQYSIPLCDCIGIYLFILLLKSIWIVCHLGPCSMNILVHYLLVTYMHPFPLEYNSLRSVIVGSESIIWASLVAQWLRIHLPMRGHGFEPWSGKIPHAAEQLSLCITREATTMRSPRTAMKSSPQSPQLERARVQQQRPNAAK